MQGRQIITAAEQLAAIKTIMQKILNPLSKQFF